MLPGGIRSGSGLAREARLRPMSSALELLLADSTLQSQPWPSFVSQVLGQAVGSIGDLAFDATRADDLCVGDRDFLMLQVAGRLTGDTFWVTAICPACGEPFDLRLSRSALPVKPAGPGYPQIDVRIGKRLHTFRVPNGTDQKRLLDRRIVDPVRHLLGCCWLGCDSGALEPATLSGADVDRIDAALDAVAPEVGRRAQTQCPACGVDQVVDMGLFGFEHLDSGRLFDDIRRLAHHCHWSEADILAMPRARRHHYLRLIDEASGAAAQGAA